MRAQGTRDDLAKVVEQRLTSERLDQMELERRCPCDRCEAPIESSLIALLSDKRLTPELSRAAKRRRLERIVRPQYVYGD